jgi:TnpA family transposase
MTVEECQARMSSAEFTHWHAWFHLQDDAARAAAARST